MDSLFPELEEEIRLDRLAERREKEQRARDYLRDKDISPVINYLLENGPTTEATLLDSTMDAHYHLEDSCKSALSILNTLHALWITRKLWRKSVGIHPGAGEESFLYGIRKVHQKPKQAEP